MSKFKLKKKVLNTMSSANITKSGSLYKMGKSNYGSVKGLRRTQFSGQLKSLRKPKKSQPAVGKSKKPYQKSRSRKTFFHDTNSFDPIYYPNHEFVKKRVGSMCLAFNKLTKRSDHNFLGLPKQSKQRQIPSILTKLRNNRHSKK